MHPLALLQPSSLVAKSPGQWTFWAAYWLQSSTEEVIVQLIFVTLWLTTVLSASQ